MREWTEEHIKEFLKGGGVVAFSPFSADKVDEGFENGGNYATFNIPKSGYLRIIISTAETVLIFIRQGDYDDGYNNHIYATGNNIILFPVVKGVLEISVYNVTCTKDDTLVPSTSGKVKYEYIGGWLQ